MNRKMISLLLAAALLLTVCSGCGASSEEPSISEAQVSETVSSKETPATETEEPASVGEVPVEVPESASDSEETAHDTFEPQPAELPLCDELTSLSILIEAPDMFGAFLTSWNDSSTLSRAEELTNVHIDWNEVSSQQLSQQFSLIVASGDMPDMIRAVDEMYAGGLSAALDEGVIYDLTDIIEEYGQDYLAAIEIDESTRKAAIDDEGRRLSVISVQDGFLPVSGTMIRQDWLDEQGLNTPVTYDDLYDVLMSFKDAYNCDHTLFVESSLDFQSLSGNLGTVGFNTSGRQVATHLYQVDGTVYSSLNQEGYRDYVELLRKFYSSGLINSDFLTESLSPPETEAVCSQGNAGVFFAASDKMTTMRSASDDPDFNAVPLASMVTEEGQINNFGNQVSYVAGRSVSVTTSCDDPELAISWLNFWFTREGSLLANYGIENDTYEFDANGVPQYTDKVLNNPDGMAVYAAVAIFGFKEMPAYFDFDRQYNTQPEEELAAMHFWAEDMTGANIMPDVSLTAAESDKISTVLTDIETYATSNIMAFVIGDQDLVEWDSFVETVEGMGLQTVIDTYQNALDRYTER